MTWILEYFFCLFVYIYIYVRLVMSSYLSSYLLFCSIYFEAWCITCCPKREESLEVYTEWQRISGISTLMLGVSHAVEVLVLGLLVLVYKIPYSSYIFNTAVVVACVIFTHGFSRCRGYWIRVFCCLFVVRIRIYIYMFGWLRRATCSIVSTSMLGISHAVQNGKKLWKFT